VPPEAKRLVSCENGQIGQIKPLQGEMPVVFEMTADINHGDCGGPVLDKKGHVIGLNVDGYPRKDSPELPGHALAVPINVAQPFLKAAGIDKLDPGPLTESWERGLRYYAAENYAAAEKEFADMLQLEAYFGTGDDNPYVRQLHFLCQKKQGKVKLPSGS
jgi:hypothetical protein